MPTRKLAEPERKRRAETEKKWKKWKKIRKRKEKKKKSELKAKEKVSQKNFFTHILDRKLAAKKRAILKNKAGYTAGLKSHANWAEAVV